MATLTPDEIVSEIVRVEGGLVDDPADKGGITNYGVSLRYLSKLGIRGDLNGDGNVDANDIRIVTPEQAKDLYLEDFYYGPRIDRLPVAIQAQLTDIAVNSGPPRAIMLLQNTLNVLHSVAPDVQPNFLKPDGVVGARTVAAAQAALDALGPVGLNDAIADTRAAFYKGLADRDPSQLRFINGWLARAASFRSQMPDWLPARMQGQWKAYG